MNRRTSLKAIAAVAAGIGATLKDPKTFPVHLFDSV